MKMNKRSSQLISPYAAAFAAAFAAAAACAVAVPAGTYKDVVKVQRRIHQFKKSSLFKRLETLSISLGENPVCYITVKI